MATPKKTAETETETGAETGTETTPANKSYKCLSHLSHNQVDYLPGSMVELEDALAETLAASGVIELPGV